MGFEKFGKVIFTTETKMADFMEYLERGKIMATKCRKCGRNYFPPRLDCPRCLLDDVEWIEVKEIGKLITYTVIHYGPTLFENDAPYVLAIGDFGGIRVFSRLNKGIRESEIEPDMPLKLVPVSLPEERISYEFQSV